MRKLENLELIEVSFEAKKAILIFLCTEEGTIREVNFNKQSYDSVKGTFIDDEEKSKKIDEWCETYFNTSFEKLGDCVGVKKDVYEYDNFNSLWEADIISKFDDDMVGTVDTAEIKSITLDDVGIRIRIVYEEVEYESKMTYSKYVESQKKYFKDPQKKAKQIAKFEEKFGVSIDNKDELIGKEIQFEVKKAMGQFVYVDLKKLKAAKKKK